METVKEIELDGGITIKIYPDCDVESPREEVGNFGHMICFHRRYNLGDKHNLSIVEARKLANSDNVVSLNLFMYDHSGLRMNTTGYSMYDPQGWDWGAVGFIYVTFEEVLKEFGATEITPELIEKAENILLDEVIIYDQYLSGDVYGYVIEDSDEEHLDSCWGFYGIEYAEEQAREAAEFFVKKAEEGLCEVL